jgi:hypothetical protein
MKPHEAPKEDPSITFETDATFHWLVPAFAPSVAPLYKSSPVFRPRGGIMLDDVFDQGGRDVRVEAAPR